MGARNLAARLKCGRSNPSGAIASNPLHSGQGEFRKQKKFTAKTLNISVVG